MRILKEWGFRIFLVFVLVVVLGILYGGLINLREENRVLKQVLKQNEMMLKEKDEQIRVLQEQMDELRKEQVEVEMKISKLKEIKVQKGKVIERMNATEVCNAFKEFGYNPVCR